MSKNIGAGLLQYESKIWSTADTLRGAGIKAGDWPNIMMPFFGLMLVESRVRRLVDQKISEYTEQEGVPFDRTSTADMDWLDASMKTAPSGYHQKLVRTDYTLADVCQVEGGNFLNKLSAYIDGYDDETKRLLGYGYSQGVPKCLDIEGVASNLFSLPNSPLYAFASKWAVVNLKSLSNSEITTVEEHIKRKWADISADTAGEQYTPSDIIDLAGDIAVELFRKIGDPEGLVDIYDMTCGGGNFLFGTEDRLRNAFPELSVRARGQELNSALYALAALEARFRPGARIELGNTLTDDKFVGQTFGLIVGNPPYGNDFKDIKTSIEADSSGRFSANRMPPTSDGQLLFLQHAVSHLSDNGIGLVVHSGSTLFAGDAGGGESETRRWLLSKDLVLGIVQHPKNEFFNTGISTYLWILCKNKPTHTKGKVLLINAENCFVKLKKNLNKKNCEIDITNRKKIVDTLSSFSDGPISRVISHDDLMYNKVDILVRRLSTAGASLASPAKIESQKIFLRIDENNYLVSNGVLSEPVFSEDSAKPFLLSFLQKIKSASIVSLDLEEGIYTFNSETGTIDFLKDETLSEIGSGKIIVSPKIIKKNGAECIKIDFSLSPIIEKDTEITGYSSNDEENKKIIDNFLSQWISDPIEKIFSPARIGCEINFNKIFPQNTQVRAIEDILEDLHALNSKSILLEQKIAEGFSTRLSREEFSSAKEKETS